MPQPTGLLCGLRWLCPMCIYSGTADTKNILPEVMARKRVATHNPSSDLDSALHTVTTPTYHWPSKFHVQARVKRYCRHNTLKEATEMEGGREKWKIRASNSIHFKSLIKVSGMRSQIPRTNLHLKYYLQHTHPLCRPLLQTTKTQQTHNHWILARINTV